MRTYILRLKRLSISNSSQRIVFKIIRITKLHTRGKVTLNIPRLIFKIEDAVCIMLSVINSYRKMVNYGKLAIAFILLFLGIIITAVTYISAVERGN